MKVTIALTEEEKNIGIADFGCDTLIAVKLTDFYCSRFELNTVEKQDLYDGIKDLVERECARDQSTVELTID